MQSANLIREKSHVLVHEHAGAVRGRTEHHARARGRVVDEARA